MKLLRALLTLWISNAWAVIVPSPADQAVAAAKAAVERNDPEQAIRAAQAAKGSLAEDWAQAYAILSNQPVEMTALSDFLRKNQQSGARSKVSNEWVKQMGQNNQWVQLKDGLPLLAPNLSPESLCWLALSPFADKTTQQQGARAGLNMAKPPRACLKAVAREAQKNEEGRRAARQKVLRLIRAGSTPIAMALAQELEENGMVGYRQALAPETNTGGVGGQQRVEPSTPSISQEGLEDRAFIQALPELRSGSESALTIAKGLPSANMTMALALLSEVYFSKQDPRCALPLKGIDRMRLTGPALDVAMRCHLLNGDAKNVLDDYLALSAADQQKPDRAWIAYQAAKSLPNQSKIEQETLNILDILSGLNAGDSYC